MDICPTCVLVEFESIVVFGVNEFVVAAAGIIIIAVGVIIGGVIGLSANGCFVAADAFITTMDPGGVVAELVESSMVGEGSCSFPGRTWINTLNSSCWQWPR